MKSKGLESELTAASLYASVNRVTRLLHHVELPAGCTHERLRTLATIQAHGPLSVTRVAEIEELRPATVSRMISSLEKEGLIRRQDAREDKRSVLVSTTAKGRQMYVRANERYLSRLRRAIEDLDPSQIELVGKLISLLESLSTQLER